MWPNMKKIVTPAVTVVALTIVFLQLGALAGETIRPTWVTFVGEVGRVQPTVWPAAKHYKEPALGLGSEVLLKSFGLKEKITRGSEFLYKPSLAKEKKLFYIYSIRDMTQEELNVLLLNFIDERDKYNWAYVPASFDKKSYAVPMTWLGKRDFEPDEVENFLRRSLQVWKKLVGSNIDVNFQQGYLAVDKPILGSKMAQPVIAPKSAWVTPYK